MDNIRDRWNEVNGKSLHVDKQMFIEQITPYCMHKGSFKEWMWCWFLKLSNGILGVLGSNIACYCCYIANQTGCTSWVIPIASISCPFLMFLVTSSGLIRYYDRLYLAPAITNTLKARNIVSDWLIEMNRCSSATRLISQLREFRRHWLGFFFLSRDVCQLNGTCM